MGPGLVTLVGPNGSGKTTLLRVLAGLLPHGGTLGVEGALAYMPQSFEFQSAMRVRDLVALGRAPHLGRLGRLSAADARAVATALGRTGTTALAARPVGTLSGGERARVALARALASEAPILLVDEPFAALDAAHALDISKRLRAEAERALVVAAIHDLALARRIADRVLVMSGGRLVASGGPQLLDGEVLCDVFGIAPPPGGWQTPERVSKSPP